MDSESAINAADLLLRQVPDPRIASSAPARKYPVVKEELQFLHLDEVSQEKILDTLQFIHGPGFELKNASDYRDEKSNLRNKFWVGQGNLVVKGGCDYSKVRDTALDETDRLKQFALFRLESYGFHKNHCIEVLEYCSENIENCLSLLYGKYFNSQMDRFTTDCSIEEILELRAEEKSSLESIFEESFKEKVKDSVWTLKIKLNYLKYFYRDDLKKSQEKTPQPNIKKKEKCKLLMRGHCRFGDKCRFSHEIDKPINSDTEDAIFELEVRFPANSKYPFEPPLVFLKKNDYVPPSECLRISGRLYAEAVICAQDGIPSFYNIVGLLEDEDKIKAFIENGPSLPNERISLFGPLLEVERFEKKSSHYKKGVTNKDNKRNYSEEEISRENTRIVEKFQAKIDTGEFKKMLSCRRDLPVWNYMNDILNTIESSQVTIISGETGCGKTTQIPQYIFDDWIIKHKPGSDQKINIICTQPRRISAIGVAERVAEERLEKIGNTVGYQIRLESKTSASTRLMFCTTGILLRRLESDPLVPEVTHILVDEAHERSEESDFLLMILREMLPLRPDLKVILMSATINAHIFSEYFGDVPIIKVPGRTFPVKQYYLEDVFDICHYVMEEGSEYARKISKDDDYLESQLSSADISYMSEKPRNGLKDEALNFRQICTRYDAHSRLTWRNLFLMDTEKINNDLIEYLLSWIVSGEHDLPKDGTIMIFLPGIAEITSLHDQLKDHPDFGLRTKKFSLLPLHSSLTSEEQAAIFQKTGARKIILCTNIAETSITIDDCVFVIDTGKMKEKRFDPNRNMESLETTWVSKANAVQRRGRAGRVMKGVCFHLYTKHRFEHHFLSQPVPEVHRVPLERLILNMKMLRTFELQDVREIFANFVEPPSDESISSSISRLQSVGALNKAVELTALGRHLATLPVDVRVGKLLLYGAIFSCVDAALTMAACLSFKNPFLSPFGKREQANAKKMVFATGFSDQITVYTAYKKWLQVYKKSTIGGRNMANENFLSFRTLVSIADIKYQFLELLVDIGFVSVDLKRRRRMGEDDILEVTGSEFNRNGENYRLLSSVICAALYPNVVKVLTPPKSYIMSAAGAIPKEVQAKDLQFATVQEKVVMHPSSINYRLGKFPSPFLVFQEKVRTSRVFFRDCSVIPLMSLVLFTGFDLDIQVHNGYTYISLENGWILLQVVEHKIAEMIKLIRSEFLDILEEKIRDPLLNLQHNEKSNRIISTILHLIST